MRTRRKPPTVHWLLKLSNRWIRVEIGSPACSDIATPSRTVRLVLSLSARRARWPARSPNVVGPCIAAEPSSISNCCSRPAHASIPSAAASHSSNGLPMRAVFVALAPTLPPAPPSTGFAHRTPSARDKAGEYTSHRATTRESARSASGLKRIAARSLPPLRRGAASPVDGAAHSTIGTTRINSRTTTLVPSE